MSNPEEIAKAFANHYYNIFDTDRKNLASLYQDHSMLTFENDKIQGKNNIVNKLLQIKHAITTIDAQPTAGGGILVFVCGNLAIDNSNQPLKFSQVFSLMPIQGQQGGFFVLNDLFRLNYC
ncbi:nuclear transport factor 2, putative [Acanthamoeba castellanii str. Neff]|uniref:Nuclear transport factor 2 n=1 Tax=Acanthamoeba castellanii (strain ATCC 30010 / Neff) TaxID=1257118 RepID=L8GXR0_ACACF|nr:nuclear transport factor 2, putative [Acanthamoeba castellanii str. Neff]ELR17780.1 nuclear transport factor 2, putative [Acanthamoeba castellanii str. Neff]